MIKTDQELNIPDADSQFRAERHSLRGIVSCSSETPASDQKTDTPNSQGPKRCLMGSSIQRSMTGLAPF
jgi:hypothetical protein